MEFLQHILDNTSVPLIYAFILGLMMAISPCPMTTNITAIGFISKDIENKKRIFLNGLLYTAGLAFSYTTLGVVLFFGASKFQLARFFQIYGERIIGPLLIFIGIIMLDLIHFKIPGIGGLSEKIENKTKAGSSWSAFILGAIFALAFCPYSAVIYFGMLIPMSVSNPEGLFLPFIFAVATGLPVIIVAYILAYSVSSIGSFYNKIKTFDKWFRKIISLVFILIGFYYVYIFYIQ